jgi:hypothetical protein
MTVQMWTSDFNQKMEVIQGHVLKRLTHVLCALVVECRKPRVVQAMCLLLFIFLRRWC